MSISHATDPWRAEVRSHAYIAVKIAAAKRTASDRALTYFINRAIAHGLTIDEIIEASDLDETTILELTDPSIAA